MTTDLATKLAAIKDQCRAEPHPATQPAARALLVAIEALEQIERHDFYGGMDARGDLEQIAAAWGDEGAA
jgi:hypothetical protein